MQLLRDGQNLFADESPRGTAVLARAYVEDALQQMLLQTAKDRPAESGVIRRALALRLKPMINAAVKVGLVKPERAERMHALRELGNAFAHCLSANNCAAPDIQPLMESLAMLQYDGPNFPHPTNSTLVSQALVFYLNDDIFAAFIRERASHDLIPLSDHS